MLPLSKLEYTPFGIKNQGVYKKMNNYIINTLDRLEVIERNHGTLGSVIGVLLIILTLVITVLSINFILKFSFGTIQWICVKFLGFNFF